MSADLLHERAALYVSGALTAPERENFELVLAFHDGLRAEVARLQRVTAAMTLADIARAMPVLPTPRRSLRDRILQSVEARPEQPAPAAMVVTDAEGRVEWINDAFTAMCGFTLEELKGRKPGHLLQGPGTDRTAVDRLRASVQARRSCQETLLNYHKDGSPYLVDVHLSPILDDDQQPLWFVAQERKLPGTPGMLVA